MPHYYDNLLAKLIVTGRTRNHAIKRALRSLNEIVIDGIETNIDLHKKILSSNDFKNGSVPINWLEKNIEQVKIIDCSWHMPNVERDGYKEYLEEHIEHAIFFDLDKNSDRMTDLPHMLTTSYDWEKIVSAMGIKNNDEIDIFSYTGTALSETNKDLSPSITDPKKINS